MSQNITSPAGRLIMGSLYQSQEKTDAKGVKKLGVDGQPLISYFFAIAVPKGTERHWAEITEWGAKIWAEGHKAHPNFAPHPAFSWKVEDGDSAIPNRKNKKNCDNPDMRGCWVLKFSSGFAPRIFNKDGSAPITEAGAVKLGYYVQVNFDVAGNTGDTPGVYLNHRMVALTAYGPEIQLGMDPAAAGFGNVALPPGATAAPAGGFNPAPPAAPAAPAAPNYPAPPAAPVAPPAPANYAPLAVPGVPPLPAAPPAPPARQMLAAANGASYEQLIANGWTDALLVQHGLMAA